MAAKLKLKSMLIGMFVVSSFCALMGASACAAIFPATMRFAAPMVCPADTVKAVVIVSTHSTGRGTSTSGQMYCMDREGGGHKAGTLATLGTLFWMYLLGLMALSGLLITVGRLRGAGAAAMLLLIGGCSIGTMSNSEFDKQYPYGRGAIFTHAGAKDVQLRFHAKIGAGAIKVTSLNLAPEYANIEAQDPQHPENFDDYDYRDGAVGKPRPEKNVDLERVRQDLFDLDAVPFDRVPEAIAAALAAAKIDDGRAKSIYVRRRDEQLRLSVTIDGTRKNATVELDADLHVIEVN